MNLRRSFAVLLFALTLAPATALAQPSDFDRTTARTLGQEGHEALDKKDWATAADRFARADALVHAPTFLLGLAQAQVGLGKLVTALETYNRILREGLPASPPPAFKRALDDARKEFDALSPRIPYVTIQVAGPGAASAKVSVDGVDVPTAALGVKRAIDPGKHQIRAVADGFAPTEVALSITEGKVESVTLELKPAAAATPPPPPPKAAPPPPPVTPPPPAAPPPATPPPDKAEGGGGSIRRTLGIAGIAVGGAGLVLGAAMGGVVIAKHGDLAKSCPGGTCPPADKDTLQPKLDSYHTFSAVSTAGFVAGGALAVTGVVLLVTAPKSKPAVGGVEITPVIGLGFAGAEGRF
jgi:hypothetical protein